MLRLAALLLALSSVTSAALADDAPASPPAAAAPAATASDSGWIADYDALWLTRDDPVILQKLYKVLQAQLKKDDGDFEANWRLASWLNWDANNYESDTKANLAKRAWGAADKASTAKPEDVRAQYNGAVGIGLYSEGVGILNALAQGLEGKFKSRIQAALRIDKDYLDGSPQVVWGRYFFRLPWPKRDVDESVKLLRAAVESHPTNLRAKWYLADSLLDSGKKEEAKKLADDVAAAPLGKDPAEDKKVKSEMVKWVASHKGDL